MLHFPRPRNKKFGQKRALRERLDQAVAAAAETWPQEGGGGRGLVFFELAVAGSVCPGWSWQDPILLLVGRVVWARVQSWTQGDDEVSVAGAWGGLGVVLVASGQGGPSWVSVVGALSDLQDSSFKYA